jgi:hypothetical protein
MREIFKNDLEQLIADGWVSEIDIASISYTLSGDELNTTLKCMVIGDAPFRWMSFRLKRFTHHDVHPPCYLTLNSEEDDIRSSIVVHDTEGDVMATIMKFIESEKADPCHQKFHFFVDREKAAFKF